MKVVVLYIGSSLLAPLRRAEHEINERYRLDLSIAAHNCTLPFSSEQWSRAESDLAGAELVFLLHVTDSENAARITAALDRFRSRHRAVIVMNSLRELMRRTCLGERELFSLFDTRRTTANPDLGTRVARKLGSWVADYALLHRRDARSRRPDEYLEFVKKVPTLLRFIPSAGALKEVKQYLTLYCYFLQPTPANIRSMVLYALKHQVPGCESLEPAAPESKQVTGIYHPDAPALFSSYEGYGKWYERRMPLDPERTVGLLLMRPHVVSGAHGHCDGLLRALESEGLPVLAVLSTFMDNREACKQFFTEPAGGAPRIGQILSLAGFSFVGGPAMNDSEAAVNYLKGLNRPFRSAVSLEMQMTEDWAESQIGLNAVQTAMQVAIPEIDGATEPFVYGGIPSGKDQPEPLQDRCDRIATRLARWDHLRRLRRPDVRLAIVIYCFPPNKGNLGTAADMDVFPSLREILRRLERDRYTVAVPDTPDILREMLLGGDHLASVAYRLSADDYYRLCPYVAEIEAEWGPAPGHINTQGPDLLIHGIQLGNIVVAVQPTFGYEGDPMRLLMAKGGTPHHGFMALYTYLEHVFRADALVHLGTHGALEFMPGKQVGLSASCWPDRLIGSFPNIYIYSVNNPSEGTIAKRRSYAELISYLTPPIESAGLYKDLASLKELITAYRQATGEQRGQLFAAIQEKARDLNLSE
ncbi:MAG TPA: cobaltochelatase subunit CobN [Bryobacteraceae bacterium]|nr:cobaltochelatase subunit CobN [Bryobacteraceae bacterium]